MRKLLLALLISAPVIGMAGNDFDRGFEAGFKEGYKQVKGDNAFAPFAPFAPFPPFDDDTYVGGYRIGFNEGVRRAEGQ